MDIVASQLSHPFTSKIFSSSQFLYPASRPYHASPVSSFVEPSRPGAQSHFTVPSYSHVHPSCFYWLGFPGAWWSPSLTPLPLSDPGVLLYLLHGCTSVTKTSWRKHTVGPTDLIFKQDHKSQMSLYPSVIATALP